MRSPPVSTPSIRYTTSIIKGAALLGEMRKLLESWQPSEPLDAFMKRVQDQDLLGKSTACRTRDIVRRVFATRLLNPSEKPALTLQLIMKLDLPSSTFNEMLFIYASRKDPLIRDFISAG